MDLPKVEKFIVNENTDTLVLFLKGLEFSSEQMSELLVKLNFAAADNISLLNRCMDQFNRFTVAECRDLMRNLGARSLALYTNQTGTGDGAMPARQPYPQPSRQIPTSQVPPMFGNGRSA